MNVNQIFVWNLSQVSPFYDDLVQFVGSLTGLLFGLKVSNVLRVEGCNIVSTNSLLCDQRFMCQVFLIQFTCVSLLMSLCMDTHLCLHLVH